MVKVFISQPMVDKTDEQIKEERCRAVNRIKAEFHDDNSKAEHYLAKEYGIKTMEE